MYDFVGQIGNTVNNLPVMKYVILKQTKLAIWGTKSQLNVPLYSFIC